MNMILLGNIVSLLGATVMVLIGLLKKPKQILTAQCVQFAVMGAGNVILGGISGAISNGLGILRNIICLKWRLTLLLKGVFILLQTVIVLLTNTEGWVGWLPVFAAASLICFQDTDDDRLLKGVILFGQILWIFYDLTIRNYTAAAFDVFATVTNGIALVTIIRQKQHSVPDEKRPG